MVCRAPPSRSGRADRQKVVSSRYRVPAVPTTSRHRHPSEPHHSLLSPRRSVQGGAASSLTACLLGLVSRKRNKSDGQPGSGVCSWDHSGALRGRRSYLAHVSVRMVFLTANNRNKIRIPYTRGSLFSYELGPGVLAAPRQLHFEGSLCLHAHGAAAALPGVGSASQGGRWGQRRGSSPQTLPPAQGALPGVSPEASTDISEARVVSHGHPSCKGGERRRFSDGPSGAPQNRAPSTE